MLLLLQRIVQVVREIVFARALGPAEYGIYTLAFFVVPVAVVIASLGIPSTLGRLIPHYERLGGVRWFLRNVYVLTIGASIILAAAIVLAPGFFSRLLYGGPEHIKIITLAGFTVPLMLVFRNVASTYLGFRLFQASSVFEFCQVALYATIGIVLVLLFSSATSAIFAYAFSFVIAMALFVPVLARFVAGKEPYSRAPDEKHTYGRLLGLSAWFVVTPILAQVFHYVDRLSIQHIMTTTDQGVYSAAVAVAVIVSAIGLAVSNVIYPSISGAWEGGRRAEAMRSLDIAIRLMAIALPVAGLVVVLLAGPIMSAILGEAYMGGKAAIPFLVAFHLFTVLVWLFGVLPGLLGKTRVAALGLAFGLPLNIVLNLALVPRMGIAGAGVATMLSYLAMWLVIVIVCRRLGFRAGPRTLILCLLPLALLLPGFWPAAVVALALLLGLMTPLLLTPEERALAAAGALAFMRGLKGGRDGPSGPHGTSGPGMP